MEHQERYTYFYSKSYTKSELLIKNFLIKSNQQDKVFINVYNAIFQYLTNDCVKKNHVGANSNLKPSYSLFENRHRLYTKNQIQNSFENEIKTAFETIPKTALPKAYTFAKLISEIAILHATYEIARVFANHVALMGMFYQLNEFDSFEIRTYDPFGVEDTPIYKQLQLKLYPKSDTFLNAQPQQEKIIRKNFNRNHWNANCFQLFHYLVGNYDKKGKIKYINIFYFLKNHVDKNKYAFGFTIEQYKEYIQTHFEIQLTKFEKAEYEFVEKVIPILSGFEQDFRKNE